MTADRAQHVLRRDGHTAGAGRWRMTDEQWAKFNGSPLARSGAEISDLINEALADRQSLDRLHWPFLDGIVAGLRWVTGMPDSPAPITGRPTVGSTPTWTEVAEEVDASEDILYGQREDSRPGGYATGVEHALMWAIADTDERPL